MRGHRVPDQSRQARDDVPPASGLLNGARRSVAPADAAFLASAGTSLERARLLIGLQATAGNAAVQRLVRTVRPPSTTLTAMTRGQRAAFVRARVPRRDTALANRIIEDMAAASDPFDFQTADELRVELTKRVTMARVMEQSQTTAGGLRAFGYPFTAPSLYWGPRVNFAARLYWQPSVPDRYDIRRDPAKRRELRSKPRHERHTVFGDPGGDYSWTLTSAGALDPYEAIVKLFVPQGAHKRSLFHCDYLVSLVHFRAFAESLGKAEFNRRIIAYGTGRIELRWNLFTELEPPSASRPGLGSIRLVVPSSEADLVVGDHVYFFNRPAYDVINENIGNAWRLENAVLVRRSGGTDVFLGHGSGHRTGRQMREKLAEEYNDVAMIALRLVNRTRRGSPAQQAAARAELATQFPGVVEDAGRFHIRGSGLLGVSVDEELRLIRASDVPGLRDPTDLSRLYPVRRAAESA